MKNIALFLVLILALTFAACAQQAPAAVPTPAPAETENADIPAGTAFVNGIVLEISDEGYLISSAESGDILVLTGEATVFDTNAEICVGDYIYVDYDGQMTFSLPAQITADIVRMYKAEGEVTEVYAEENALLMNDAQLGDIYVYLPAVYAGSTVDFAHITVYFDGVMTMSMPGRISAGAVIPGYSIQGAVSEISDGYIMIGEGAEQIRAAFAEGTLPETVETGSVVRVIYDGQMTRSIPAQINAQQIIQLSR